MFNNVGSYHFFEFSLNTLSHHNRLTLWRMHYRSDGVLYYNLVLSFQLSKTFEYIVILFQQWLCAKLQYTDVWISVPVKELYQVHFQHCLLRQYRFITMASDNIDFNFVCVSFVGDIYCGFAHDGLLISISLKSRLICRVP